jgi:group I intron endonuclease
MYGFIYLTTNLINQKKYIGYCSHKENGIYLGSGKLLKRAIKKYGRNNFKREILEECSSFEEMSKAEKFWVEKFDAVNDPNFYNLVPGGLGGNSEVLKIYWNKFSPEERKKLRNWDHSSKESKLRGRTLTEEHKNKISDTEKGKEVSLETRIKNSKATKGKKNPMFGRSAVVEQNLKWYTNGVNTIYVTENTQPKGFKRGRTYKRKIS